MVQVRVVYILDRYSMSAIVMFDSRSTRVLVAGYNSAMASTQSALIEKSITIYMFVVSSVWVIV